MPKLITDESPIFEGNFEDISDIQDDIDRQMAEIIGEFGAEEVNTTRIKFYRTIPNQGKMEWLFDITPAELPVMEKLRDEYGGGRYQARLYAKDSNDKIPRLKKSFEILIGEPKKPVFKPDNNKEVVTVMIEGFNKLGELIAAARTPAAPVVDPVAMQQSILQNMVLMKQIIEPGNKGGGENPLAQLKDLVEVQKMLADMTPGGGGDDNAVFTALINNVLPQLAKMGEQEQTFQQQIARQKLANRKTVGTTQPTNKPTQPIQEAATMNPLKPHIIFLTQMAAHDHDPETYARMVIDNTPADQLPGLVEFISGKNAIEQLTAIHKPAGQYPGWFRQLGECVLYLIQESDDTTYPAGVTGMQLFTVGDNVPKPETDFGPITADENHGATLGDTGRTGGNPGDVEDNA
jgi:hypothetical protein